MRNKAFNELDDLAESPYFSVVGIDEYTEGGMCYSATHPELPGCRGQGDTPEEAEADLEEATKLYIESLVEDGLGVPEPNVILLRPVNQSENLGTLKQLQMA